MSKYASYREPKCGASCPLYTICDQVPTKTFREDVSDPNAPVDFLFLTEYPSWKESQMRNFWISSVGRVITNTLETYYPQVSYSISAAVRAWPYDPSKLIAPQYNGSKASLIPEYVLQRAVTAPVHRHPYYHEIVKNCMQHWQTDIEQLRPKTIVVMGNVALYALFPREQRSILELADETLYYEHNGAQIPVKFVTSPHFILNKPALKDTWIKRFRRAIENKKESYWDYNIVDYNSRLELAPKEHAGYYPENMVDTVSGLPYKYLNKDGQDTRLLSGEIYGYWELITSVDRVIEVCKKLISDKKPVSTDTETLNLFKKHNTQLGMLQFGNDPRHIYAIPWVHYESPFLSDDLDRIRPYIKELLESPDIPLWYTWNGKFENNIFENAIGASMESTIYDGVVGEFLLDENRLERVSEYKYGVYTLKQIGLERLGFDGWDKGVLKHRGEGSLMDLPLLKIAEYGCLDVGITQLCCESQIAEAKQLGYDNFLPLMYGLIDPIIRVFSQVERDGFPASREYVRSLVQRSSPILKIIQESMKAVQESPEGQRANQILLDRTTRAGVHGVQPLARTPMIFDFAKQGHAQTLFFQVMKLEPISISEAGTASVDDEFQKAYKHIPLVKKYSEWVEARKMFDSFAKQLYDYLDPAGPHSDSKIDQRIRPNYKVSGVVTGRIACNEPNLQAIPRADSEVKKMIKNIFQVTEKGKILVQLDFKANEMGWATIASGDKAMAKKLNMGKEALDKYRFVTQDIEDLKYAQMVGDIHRQNASSAFKTKIDEVTKHQRQAAKGISFGILYDSTEKSVAELYGLDLQETIEMFQNFYQEHHWIYGWKMEMKEMARSRGYVEAPHGRRRRFPIFDLYRNEQGWFDENLVPREHRSMIADALRQSSNAPIQGVASDAANIGAYLLLRYIKKNKKDWKMVNVVHDSCVVEIPFLDIDEYLQVAEKTFTTDIQDYMSGMWDIDFIAPIQVDFDLGTTWANVKAWDFSPNSLREIKEWLEPLVFDRK